MAESVNNNANSNNANSNNTVPLTQMLIWARETKC